MDQGGGSPIDIHRKFQMGKPSKWSCAFERQGPPPDVRSIGYPRKEGRKNAPLLNHCHYITTIGGKKCRWRRPNSVVIRYVNYADANMAEWERKGREITIGMHESTNEPRKRTEYLTSPAKSAETACILLIQPKYHFIAMPYSNEKVTRQCHSALVSWQDTPQKETYMSDPHNVYCQQAVLPR